MAKKKDEVFRCELDGETLELDLETLTFGELAQTEIYFGQPFHEIPGSVRWTMWLIYLAKKRANPQFDIGELADIQPGTSFKEVKKSKRPTKPKTPASSGTQD
jgi:hypothetical protein